MRNTKCVSKRFSSNEWPAPGALRWCLKGDWLNGQTDSTSTLGLILLNVFGVCMTQQLLQRWGNRDSWDGFIVTFSDQQMSAASSSGSASVRVSPRQKKTTCRVTVARGEVAAASFTSWYLSSSTVTNVQTQSSGVASALNQQHSLSNKVLS